MPAEEEPHERGDRRFEKLIHDFPGEKELIAKAREHLPSELALRPIRGWTGSACN
jgi:hypothetical protein